MELRHFTACSCLNVRGMPLHLGHCIHWCGCLGVPRPDSLVSVAKGQVLVHLAQSDDAGLRLLMRRLHQELSWAMGCILS